MDSVKASTNEKERHITIEDVNRLLEVGRLLMSVLKPEEIKVIQAFLTETSVKYKTGNTGVP
jgi:hypothetical protein